MPRAGALASGSTREPTFAEGKDQRTAAVRFSRPRMTADAPFPPLADGSRTISEMVEIVVPGAGSGKSRGASAAPGRPIFSAVGQHMGLEV
jgi:hypothetical protein